MNTMSVEQTGNETARWLRFLSRWALVTALAILTVLIVFVGGVGFTAAATGAVSAVLR